MDIENIEGLEEAIQSAVAEAVKDAVDDIKDDVESAVEDAVDNADIEGTIEEALQQNRSQSSGPKLYILSQDRKHLGEFVCADIWDGTSITVATVPGMTQRLGNYATEEEAIAELGRITDALEKLRPGEIGIYRMK